MVLNIIVMQVLMVWLLILAKYSKERKCQDKWEQKELLFRILKS